MQFFTGWYAETVKVFVYFHSKQLLFVRTPGNKLWARRNHASKPLLALCYWAVPNQPANKLPSVATEAELQTSSRYCIVKGNSPFSIHLVFIFPTKHNSRLINYNSSATANESNAETVF